MPSFNRSITSVRCPVRPGRPTRMGRWLSRDLKNWDNPSKLLNRNIFPNHENLINPIIHPNLSNMTDI
jgi:hypothetical protein